jgi:RNA polymerase sigma factor (sigma-70 family)
MKWQFSSPSEGTSDAELVMAARRGDKRAFVEIVARHQAMVCGVALAILGDFAASEDVGQEAFLTAWRKIHELREPERLRAWLGQIARNAALGQIRRRRGHESLDEAMLVTDDSANPAEATASREEAAMVRDSLAKLPETYRLPLVLYYCDGKSVRSVAETLALSEDAVKQRLARGREMLQERMAALIETTLTQSRPSAVFTMTIAVAIGALAAPAVMAGAAFAAGSAGGASSTSAFTKTLLTAMSTSKVFLVASAVVALVCIPIGSQIRLGESRPQRNVLPEAAAEKPSASHVGTNDFLNSPLFAEWRDLHTRYGTNAQAMPVLYKAINDLKDPFRRQAFRTALLAEWAQVDLAGGIPFFLGKGPDDNQRRQFFEECLARDPRTTVETLLSTNTGWNNFPLEVLPEVARVAPERLAEVVSHLPEAERFYDTNVRDAFAILAQGGMDSAVKAAEAVTGPNRTAALGGIAYVWAKGDLDGAVAWAKSLPEGTDRNEIIRAALVGKATVDPAAALDALGLVPPGGSQGWFASTVGGRVLDAAAAANFDATVAWVSAHPGRLSREDLEGLAQPVTERLNADATGFLTAHMLDGSLTALLPAIDSALLNAAAGQRPAVWEWLKTQPETEATRNIKREVLNSAAWQDPDFAMQLVADLPQTTQGDAEVQELARCLFNGGNMLHRFDRILPEAPDRLREPLAEQAFASLSGEYLGDPQGWLNRLSLVPDGARPKAIGSLAGAWAQQSPEDAVAWAASLGAGDSQNEAAAGIAKSWAAKDAHGAADWVASLPAGPERDRGAQALVLTVAEQFPREAWDWAVSINDDAERKTAAARAAKAVAARDPATARQLIEAGPFTAESKAELLAGLQKPAASN